VNEIIQKMSTEMYQKAAAEQQKAAQGKAGADPKAGKANEEKVVDAEVVDEKKDKKK